MSRTLVPSRTTASFFVYGLPAPQGSKTSVPTGAGRRIIEGSSDSGRAKTLAWRTAVAQAAAEVAAELDGKQFTGPTRLVLELQFPRPRSRPRSHHGWHVVKPDKDKVLRATLDGLKAGGLIRDDSLICDMLISAREGNGATGARISLRALGSSV